MATEFVLEPTIIDISYKRGDSRAITFKLTDSETKLPIDLSLYSAPVLAVNSLTSPPDITTEIFKITGIIDGTPTTGKVSFSPTTIESDVSPKTYFYDAQIIDNNSKLLTFVEGKFKITQDKAKD